MGCNTVECCTNGDVTESRFSFALASYGGQVEEIKRLDASLENTVMHGDDASLKEW